MRLRTVADLMQRDARRLREHFTVVLERTIRELQGEPCIGMEDTPQRSSRSSPAAPSAKRSTPPTKWRSRSANTWGAAFKLRAQRSVTACVGVWIETNRFRTQEEQHQASRTVALPLATDDTGALTAWAVAIMRAIFKPGMRYWKSGVMLMDIRPKGQEQLCMFDAAPAPIEGRRSTLARVLDAVNAKWGRGTLGIGSAGLAGGRRWAMRRDLLSPRYTTRWDELPIARA